MLEPTPELKSEIGSLQWMNDEQLKKMYAELIPDAQNCAREDVLRSLIAYRLQERFYNLKLSESSKKTLAKTVEGDKLMRASWEARKPSKHRLVRNWKGVDYEVTVHADGRVEFDGKMYRSLTAVAKAITGSHWNGPVFFGVK